MKSQTSPVGLSIQHDSAQLHVTGKALYVDDMPCPSNTLFAALGQSTIASGLIKSIDLSSVLKAPGVVDVITFKELKGLTDVGPVFPGDPLLANEEVCFFGQALFVVVAESERQAREAALLAQVDYEITSPILSIDEAVAHQSRVRPPHSMVKGDAKQAINTASLQLTGKVSVGGQEHLYLEGQVALALPSEEGGVHLYCSTQHPTEVQTLVSEVLGLSFNQVVVEVRRMGGAFGGKETQAAPWACLASLAAVRSGRAVKFRLPRSIDMSVTGKRHPFENHYTVGFDNEGRVQGVDIAIHADCGCSPDLSDAIVDRAMFHADNAYHYPKARVVGERWRTHKVSNTAFRGFGGPQGVIIAESMMDDIARSVDKDPLDVRMLNLYQDQTTHYGQAVDGELLHEVMTKLRLSSHYDDRRTEITRAMEQNPDGRYLRGLALTPVKFGISFTVKHLNQAGVLIHIYTDGSVLVSQAGVEMGQGLFTKVSQIVAAVLGIDIKRVKMSASRTDKVPNTSPTAASSGSDLNGMAAKNAAIELRRRLAEQVAFKHNIDIETISFKEDKVFWDGGSLTFAELVKQAYNERVQLSATGFYRTPHIWYDRHQAKGRPFLYYATGAACSEVKLDRVTGRVSIERVDILHDTGSSLNPALDIGQIEGGFMQGAGWLMNEELVWDDAGRLQTQSPATYKIPAISDRPKVLNIALLERPNSEATVFHSKAVGEPPFMLATSLWCAIRDAISSVSGYRISPNLEAPATPERVLWALRHTEDNL